MPTAPKDLRKNLQYRRKIWELGQSSQSARDDIWIACARDPLFFINVFGWTFDPQHFADSPERPLITWPHQDVALKRVFDSIGKNSLIFPKTRRMGVTTLVLAAFFWRWKFRPRQSFLLLSAKEDRVDKKGDPSSLFWKLDYMESCLPSWMRTDVDRASLRFLNPENGSVVNGESTNADADRGGVRTAALADEVGVMQNAHDVINAISPLTESLFLVSTPRGAVGAFYEMYEKWSVEAPERVVTLHWTMHQEFAKGLYFTDEKHTGYTDLAWNGRKPRSPWYDKECLDLIGSKRIAQELDIAWNEAGGQFFEEELIRLVLQGCQPPALRGELGFEQGTPAWTENPSGKLKLWTTLAYDGLPPYGKYGVGFDIAMGMGGEMSSQSAASVVNLQTGEKVAEYTYNRITPEKFARFGVALARWFHNAKMIWGRKGPGGPFGRIVTEDCGYYNIFLEETIEEVGGKKTRKMGHTEQGPSRDSLFMDYRDALTEGHFVNPSVDAVKECRQFVIGPDGSIQHSKAIQRDQDPENSGKLHGDVVIADALSNRLLKDAKPAKAAAWKGPPPVGSPAWKLSEYLREKRDRRLY